LSDSKNKLTDEGSQLVSITNQLKMEAYDGKMRPTDVMDTELVLNMLAEVATTDISIVRQPNGFEESADVAKEGAKAAKAAREQLEKSTGKPAISSLNAKELGKRKNLAIALDEAEDSDGGDA